MFRISLIETVDCSQLLRLAAALESLMTPERTLLLKRFCNWYIKFSETPVYEQWDIETFVVELKRTLPLPWSHSVSARVSVYFDFVVCVFELDCDAPTADRDTVAQSRGALEALADSLFRRFRRQGLIRLVPQPPTLHETAQFFLAQKWSHRDGALRIQASGCDIELQQDGRFYVDGSTLAATTQGVRTVVDDLAAALAERLDFDVLGHRFVVWKYRRLLVLSAVRNASVSFNSWSAWFLEGREQLDSVYTDDRGEIARLALAHERAFQEGRLNPTLAVLEFAGEEHVPTHGRICVADLAYAHVAKSRSLYTYFLFEDCVARLVSALDRQAVVRHLHLSDRQIRHRIQQVLDVSSEISQEMLLLQHYKRDLDACSNLLARMASKRGTYKETAPGSEQPERPTILRWLEQGPTVVLAGPGRLLMNPTDLYKDVIDQVTHTEGIAQQYTQRLLEVLGSIRRERAENALRILGFLLAGSVSADLVPFAEPLVSSYLQRSLSAPEKIGVIAGIWASISGFVWLLFWFYSRAPHYREVLLRRLPETIRFAATKVHSLGIRGRRQIVSRWREVTATKRLKLGPTATDAATPRPPEEKKEVL